MLEQIDHAIELAKRGEFWPAIHLYEEAWLEAERQGDTKGQFNALNGLSNVANLLNSPAMARACLLKAWALAELIGDRRMLFAVAYNLAGLEFRWREYEQAQLWLGRCREIAEELEGGAKELAYSYHGLAVLHEEMGELEEALEYLKQGLLATEQAEELEQSFRGALLSTQGSLLVKLGRYQEAVAVLSEAVGLLEGAEVYQVLPLLNLAEAHFKLGEEDESKGCYQRASSIIKRLGEATEPDYLLRLKEVGRTIGYREGKSKERGKG